MRAPLSNPSAPCFVPWPPLHVRPRSRPPGMGFRDGGLTSLVAVHSHPEQRGQERAHRAAAAHLAAAARCAPGGRSGRGLARLLARSSRARVCAPLRAVASSALAPRTHPRRPPPRPAPPRPAPPRRPPRPLPQGGRRLCPGDPPRVAALVQSAGAPRCHLAILSPAGRRAGWLPLPGSQLECAEKPAGERSPAAESPKSPGFPESVRPVDPDFPRRSTPRPRAPRQTGPTRPSTDLAEPAATRARGTAVLAACSKGGGVCSENEL
jgi:hypothetical protein